MAELKNIKDRIEFDFTNHTPSKEGIALIEANRKIAKEFATHVADLPVGREQSLAITKIEEALFYANAAVARTHLAELENK